MLSCLYKFVNQKLRFESYLSLTLQTMYFKVLLLYSVLLLLALISTNYLLVGAAATNGKDSAGD